MPRKKKGQKGLRDLGLDKAFSENDDLDDYEDPFVSKVQVDEEPERPTVNQLDYHTSLPETVKLFEQEGFSLGAINAERGISGQSPIADFKPIRRFFSRIDLTKAELETHIPVIKRQKVFFYKKDKKGKLIKNKGEALVWHLQLRGVDFLGAPMYASIENEGIASRPRIHVDVSYDQNTGRQVSVRRFKGITEKRYYVSFSKTKVDSLINKFNNGEKEGIKFYCVVPTNNQTLTEEYHTDIHTYEQFVNTDFEQFVDIARKWHDKREKDKLNKGLSLQEKGIA